MGPARPAWGDLHAVTDYIADESWKRYATKEGLIQKTWFSDPAGGEFGAFYLWESEEHREEEIRTMQRVKAMTGRNASIHRYEVEAIQKGLHAQVGLTRGGLAWSGGAPPEV